MARVSADEFQPMVGHNYTMFSTDTSSGLRCDGIAREVIPRLSRESTLPLVPADVFCTDARRGEWIGGTGHDDEGQFDIA